MAVGVNLIPVTGVTLPAREHGRQFIPVHVRIDWYYTHVCKKPEQMEGKEPDPVPGDKRTCSSVIFEPGKE